MSIGFSRKEYWGGLPFPSPGGLPDPGIKPASLKSPALAGKFFTTGATWKRFFGGSKNISFNLQSKDIHTVHKLIYCLLTLLKLHNSLSAFKDYTNPHEQNLEENVDEKYFCVYRVSKISFLFLMLLNVNFFPC